MKKYLLAIMLALSTPMLASWQHPQPTYSFLEIFDVPTGEPQVLLEFFGGQGSLNVNSWSPDSRQFAFMPQAGTRAFVVELEEASTPNILQGLRESALYLRNMPEVP